MHLGTEEIQRLLHGELSEPDSRELQRHLADCAACRVAYETAEQEEAWIFERLGALDHPAPVRAGARPWAEPRESARAGRFERLQWFARAGWFWPNAQGWAPRAAAIALTLSAAAATAYVLPGSPLPGWIEKIAGRGDAPESSGSRIPGVDSGASHPVTPAVTTAGISVDPGSRLLIAFSQTQVTGDAVVVLGSSPLVSIRVTGGAARFDSDSAQLGIINPGSTASYVIELPTDSPAIEIRVAGRVLFTKLGDAIISDASVDANGRRKISLSPR